MAAWGRHKIYSISTSWAKTCKNTLNFILAQKHKCYNCTYCRENSICGNSFRHTALPRHGKLSHGTLRTCCLLPSLALFAFLRRETEVIWEAEASGARLLCLFFFYSDMSPSELRKQRTCFTPYSQRKDEIELECFSATPFFIHFHTHLKCV